MVIYWGAHYIWFFCLPWTVETGLLVKCMPDSTIDGWEGTFGFSSGIHSIAYKEPHSQLHNYHPKETHFPPSLARGLHLRGIFKAFTHFHPPSDMAPYCFVFSPNLCLHFCALGGEVSSPPPPGVSHILFRPLLPCFSES